jgi:hypothetical protein
MGGLVLALLRPPPPRDPLGEEIETPEWETPPVDPVAFTTDVWAATERLIGDLVSPARLSKLLTAAEQALDFNVADLVRLRALIATTPDLDAVRPGASPVTAAAGDGTTFRSRWFVGSDLLVGTLSADETTYKVAGNTAQNLADGSLVDSISSDVAPTAGSRDT